MYCYSPAIRGVSNIPLWIRIVECALVLCSVFLGGLFLSIFFRGSWLSALCKKQTTEQLVLTQHSAGLSTVRCGGRRSTYAVTLLACHQGHTFTKKPLGLSGSRYRVTSLSSCKSLLSMLWLSAMYNICHTGVWKLETTATGYFYILPRPSALLRDNLSELELEEF